MEAAEHAGLTPLLGRDHEVSLLKDRWEQAQEGMGQVVLIIGEPGLGKSRLVHTIKQFVRGQAREAVAAARRRPPESVGRRPVEGGSPVIEWRCFAALPEQRPASRRRFLRAIPRFRARRGAGMPGSTGWSATFESTGSTVRMSCRSSRRSCRCRPTIAFHHSACRRSASGKKRSGPCANGCAPTPSAGPSFSSSRICTGSTRPLWSFWASSSPRACTTAVLTLLTFRPEFQTPWPAVAHQTTLALNRLTRRQVGDLMRKTREGALPEAVIDQILRPDGRRAAVRRGIHEAGAGVRGARPGG